MSFRIALIPLLPRGRGGACFGLGLASFAADTRQSSGEKAGGDIDFAVFHILPVEIGSLPSFSSSRRIAPKHPLRSRAYPPERSGVAEGELNAGCKFVAISSAGLIICYNIGVVGGRISSAANRFPAQGTGRARSPSAPPSLRTWDASGESLGTLLKETQQEDTARPCSFASSVVSL